MKQQPLKIKESSEVVSKKDYDTLLGKYEDLERQLTEIKRLIFGSKRERFVGVTSDQLALFDTQKQEGTTSEEQIHYTREKSKKKNKAKRQLIPSHLPRIEEIIEPKDIESGAKKIGEEITEILEYNPAKIYVRRIVRPKYTQPSKQSITIAELPSLPLPKSNAGASLLAQIMVDKFVNHLPFYRQIQILKRQKLTLSDATITGWFNATTTLITPLYQVLEKQVLQSSYLQADESPIKVQDHHKKGKLHTGYHWVYHAPVEGLVLFKYDPSRSSKAPATFLQNYSGTLQTDGYKVYYNLPIQGTVKSLSCMAHARRYFEKALDQDPSRATYVLQQIQYLYAIERKAKDKGIDLATKSRYRSLYSKAILNRLRKWLEEHRNKTLPKSSIGRAFAYSLNLWDSLIAYIENPLYNIDNNLIENAIRPLALGRKNYLFAGSHSAAQKAAMMYSLFATCKINNIEPFSWLHNTLKVIADYSVLDLHLLLPNSKP